MIRQSQSELVIKPTTDKKSIIQTIHAAFKRYDQTDTPSSAMQETEETIEQNLRDGYTIIGAHLQGKLAGVVKVAEIDANLYFSRLAVTPTMQGKGIASALITAILDLAHKQNKARVFCTVRQSEKLNIKLYKRHGFAIIQEEHSTNCNGITMPIVTLEYKL